MWNEGRTEKVGSAYGFTDRFVLGPNEVTPFRVLAKAAPRFANATATVEVRRPFTDRRLGKLQLVQHTLTQQSPLILIKGTVKNIDDKPQHFVKVIALARDKRGSSDWLRLGVCHDETARAGCECVVFELLSARSEARPHRL